MLNDIYSNLSLIQKKYNIPKLVELQDTHFHHSHLTVLNSFDHQFPPYQKGNLPGDGYALISRIPEDTKRPFTVAATAAMPVSYLPGGVKRSDNFPETLACANSEDKQKPNNNTTTEVDYNAFLF